MSALAAVYVHELANGNVPDPESPEAVEYHRWSKEYESARLAEQIVKESCLKVWGHGYYLLGSVA
jgi:hypothetical protein